MKKRKRKLLLTHSQVEKFITSDGILTVTAHRDCRTGLSLYSVDLDGVPVITCDNKYLLCVLCQDHGEWLVEELADILMYRDIEQTFSHSESEE